MLFAIAALALTEPARAQESSSADVVERYSLANGLTVILSPDPTQVTVQGLVAYGVGTRDDPPGYGGLAHLTEHMAFRGTLNVADGEADAHYAAVGAQLGGATNSDLTIYFAELPAEALPRFLWLESDRMAFALEAMSERSLAIERNVVRNELRQNKTFQQNIRSLIQHAVTPRGHPYYAILDEPPDPAELSLDNVRWFFQRYYRPDNATLVLVGRLDPARTRELVERYFGGVRARGRMPPRPSAPAIALRGKQRMRFASPKRFPSLAIQWNVPCAIEQVDCRARAEMLRTVLERLLAPSARNARDARSIAVELTAFERFMNLRIIATLREEPDRDGVLAHIERVLLAIRSGRIDTNDLRTAQRAHATTTLFEQESLRARAFALLQAPEKIDKRAIEAAIGLDVASVAALARQLLPATRCLVVDIDYSRFSDYRGKLIKTEGDTLPTATSGATK